MTTAQRVTPPSARELLKVSLRLGALSNNAISRILGITQSHLQRWVSGEREIGAPYSWRLLHLVFLKQEELAEFARKGTPMDESVFYERHFDWTQYWMDYERGIIQGKVSDFHAYRR